MITLIAVTNIFLLNPRSNLIASEESEIREMWNELLKDWDQRIPYEDIIQNFEENIERFNTAATYVAEYPRKDDENFVIEEIDGELVVKLIGVSNQKKVKITDEDVKTDIIYLFRQCNYQSIDDDSGNGIYFTLNDTNIGFGHGVVFTKDSQEPDGWGVRLTKIEKISDNWYYFEAK